MALQAQIGTMFNPRSVAIIGASRTIGKWGFTFTLHLIRGGYRGTIYPINPAGGEILGQKDYRNLRQIPGPVDLAFILLPPEKVAAAITECGTLGIPACVVITAGFAELGKQGAALERDIAAAARKANVAMIGPNCAGIISTEPASLYCMMQPDFPPSGHIAV
ncbi:MAG: CoA-binding protein, partial [Deltaproteobacteria bacterium]|nr:CoA-binding protein [Deltaproteobacteria bacterium]